MRFNPLTKEQAAAQASNLWEDGIYDYEITEAEETISKSSGNEMFHLTVKVFQPTGQWKLIDNYLVLSEKAAWKIREFCQSCGLMDAYETGSLMEGEIVGRTGLCEVATDKGKGDFPPKNVIRQWMMKEKPASAAARLVDRRTKHPAGDIDDEIPF